ncbi:hypothetical protein AB0H18_05515, partial [Streptomyces sp. NPDC020766]|uniref:hypothetical protein n=1 Tax=Streptomyces sp. NPDC020766 TaxID=3155011 RepID=UPI0033D762B4
MIRYDALDLLPVRGALPGLGDALDAHGGAVLVAPPGTGKTTLVPLVLAGLVGDGPVRRVVVAEPRRILRNGLFSHGVVQPICAFLSTVT